jgi:Zn-dependent membrane protease YugP
MDGLGLYLLFIIPPLVIGLVVQHWLKNTFARNANIPVQSGMSGADVARTILDRNGLTNVPVEQSPGGPLSDHYDPRKRAVYLSEPVYHGRSISAAAVGAHEVGHAIQHAKAYKPMEIRSALWPAVSLASQGWMLLLLGGFLLNIAGLFLFAIILYAVVVLFQLVTLPVEFDASRRAGAQLAGLGLVTETERGGVKKVLTAAAMTYVAGALAAISQLIYFLMLFNNRN